MLFNSYVFIIGFLPMTLFLYYFSAKKCGPACAKWVLILASLFFYSWWDVGNLPILLGSIVVNYLTAERILAEEGGKRKIWLAVGVTFNLALLGYFKYAGFTVDNLNGLLGMQLPVPEIALPLGDLFLYVHTDGVSCGRLSRGSAGMAGEQLSSLRDDLPAPHRRTDPVSQRHDPPVQR